MALRNVIQDPVQLKKELSPAEQDPRFLELIKEYKCTHQIDLKLQ